jgi:hypothetical protein
MANLTRLGINHPAANTDTLLYTADGTYIVSVVASNISPDEQALVDIYLLPTGGAYKGYLAGSLRLLSGNPYETFRVAMNPNDRIYVRSTTASVSFLTQGILQD